MVRSTDRPDMTLDVYRGRKTTNQQQQQHLGVSSMTLAGRVTQVFNVKIFVVQAS